jgi:hypothetical protein
MPKIMVEPGKNLMSPIKKFTTRKKQLKTVQNPFGTMLRT